YRYFPGDFLSRPPILCGRPYLRGGGSGVRLHSRILAGADAASAVFLKTWVASVFRRFVPEAFYSADPDGVHDLRGWTSAADPFSHAGNHTPGIYSYGKGKGSFRTADYL